LPENKIAAKPTAQSKII